MADTIEGRARELVEAPNFCHVATLRADGTVHLVPVWAHVDAGHLVMNSAEGRGWVRDLERDPRVTCTVMNMDNPYEFVEIRGRVVEQTREGADEQIDFLAKKYMGVDSYPFRNPDETRITVRVAPERVLLRT